MTDPERHEERAGTPAGDAGRDERPEGREAPGAQPDPAQARVPAPTPEEAPELLGERSDYPIAWDGEES